ncbi:MAG: WD40 repeat domain-containing protein [Chloroflexota bacterium]
MSELDPLQLQREILHIFRQATAQRAQAEADAAAQLAEARKAVETAQASLSQAGLQHLLEQTRPSPTVPRPDVDPAQELTRCVSTATGASEAIHADVEALRLWRVRRELRLAALVVGLFVSISIIAAFISGAQPCGWVDVLLGRPSGCLGMLSGHGGLVRSVTFSPDGKTLVSGSDDRAVKLWEVASGREVRALSGHTSPVSSVAFSPDGKTLASGSDDKTVKLWEVASGREVRALSGHTSPVSSVAFSPDGKTLASGSYQEIKLWEVATGWVRTLSGHWDWVSSVTFSPDGEIMAWGNWDYTVKLWRVR